MVMLSSAAEVMSQEVVKVKPPECLSGELKIDHVLDDGKMDENLIDSLQKNRAAGNQSIFSFPEVVIPSHEEADDLRVVLSDEEDENAEEISNIEKSKVLKGDKKINKNLNK